METKVLLEAVVQEVELLEEVEVVGDHLHQDWGLGPQPLWEWHHDMMNNQLGSSPRCSQEIPK